MENIIVKEMNVSNYMYRESEKVKERNVEDVDD